MCKFAKTRRFKSFRKTLPVLAMLVPTILLAQQPTPRKWQFGGGLGIGIGSGYTDITIAPGAIYNFNQYLAAGFGLQMTYSRVRNDFESYLYGGSVMALVNPIPQLQLSVEVEQLRVNTKFAQYEPFYPYLERSDRSDNFWNTALFLGAGYRVENVTLGVRYNVLFDRNRSVYGDAFMPFIRAYF